MIGGKDFRENQFNIATQKGRPTGSTFKVFTLIAALEEGINPATRINCGSRYKLASGLGTVENFGGINYGVRSIASATAVSSNTAYVQIQEKLGGATVIEVARRMGVKEADLASVDTLTLGVYDVTPLEMASAYATLAAGGIYHEPVLVTKIVDRHGETIYEPEETEGERVIDANICGAAIDVLKTVFTQYDGTAYGYGLADGRPVAGKTGTSSDFRDHWIVGFTPDLCAAIWIGDRSNQYMSEGLSCNYLFKTFMDAALSGKDFSYFPSYSTPYYNSPLNKAFTAKEAPDLTGLTLEEIEKLLKDENYNITYKEEFSDEVEAGKVISQEQSNFDLTIIISKGPDPDKPAEGEGEGEGGNTPGEGEGGNAPGGGGGTSEGGGTSGGGEGGKPSEGGSTPGEGGEGGTNPASEGLHHQ